MTDRTSKVLLAFIAMGLWANALFPYSGQMRPLLRPYPVWWAIFPTSSRALLRSLVAHA
jgi:hypothetical protein